MSASGTTVTMPRARLSSSSRARERRALPAAPPADGPRLDASLASAQSAGATRGADVPSMPSRAHDTGRPHRAEGAGRDGRPVEPARTLQLVSPGEDGERAAVKDQSRCHRRTQVQSVVDEPCATDWDLDTLRRRRLSVRRQGHAREHSCRAVATLAMKSACRKTVWPTFA